jgi:ketosteroid isomerase-like protein
MDERERTNPVSLPTPATSGDEERRLTAPNFDARSIRRARPAVPLSTADERRPAGLTWVVVALVAGMLGGLLGLGFLSFYQNRQNPAARAGEAAPATQAQQPSTQAVSPASAGVSQSADGGAQQQQPAPVAGHDAPAPAPPASEAQSLKTAAPVESDARAGVAEATRPAPAGGAEDAELRGALAAWLAATNARDIERQMDFYDARMSAFYLTRDAPREAVRAEKAGVFARASAVDVRASEPEIRLSPDGRAATMRFRKQYRIETAGGGRSGAVLQELRWRRTPDGWKITSERDLRVLN